MHEIAPTGVLKITVRHATKQIISTLLLSSICYTVSEVLLCSLKPVPTVDVKTRDISPKFYFNKGLNCIYIKQKSS